MSLAAIFALIKELFAMPGQLRALIDDFKGFRAEFDQWRTQKWIQKTNEDFAPISNGPSTTEDKKHAAENISGDISHL